MLVSERKIVIPLVKNHDNLLHYFSKMISKELNSNEIPIRFVVTHTDEQGYHCEVGIISNIDASVPTPKSSIFDYTVRSYANAAEFNAVLLIPTGIGAEIGGHSGDGGVLARLLATSCDNLIVHPNVVNASDINEAPENTLYVEGSVITRLLMGTVSLQKVNSNRVMLVIDKHEDSYYQDSSVNALSAARVTMGLDCPLVVIMDKSKIMMQALYSNSGRAVGQIQQLEDLCEVLEKYRSQYDAVAFSTLIDVPLDLTTNYFQQGLNTVNPIVNPWGGVEAMLTHTVSLLFDIPSAHSPMNNSEEDEVDLGIVDPRKAAEAISVANLHCILKGLHKSPRIINSLMYGHSGILTVADISCLVIPYGCVGLPTLAALEQGIPVIAIKENRNLMKNKLEELPFAPGKLFIVENYMEAVGVMNALKAGVTPESVRRPIGYTRCVRY